jgi:NitT/TauT family transport system substrate-binding protein
MSRMLAIGQCISCIGVAVCALMLVSCNNKTQDPLRIASSPWPGYEPLYLARDLGYFEPGKVNVFELPSADITIESFRNTSADMATLTLDETLGLIHDGLKLRILLAMDISHGGDAVMARPDIKTLADIRGKRIAIVNIPLGQYMLRRTLESAGVQRNEVTVILMPESKQEEFYRQGKADVVITYEPVKSKLLNAGAHVIFDSSQIPNEIFDLLLVHENVYQQRRADVCHVVQQWFKTLDYMAEHKDDAALRITRRLGMKPQEYAGLMSGIVLPSRSDNKKLLGGVAPDIQTPAGKLQQIMLNEKMLTVPVNFMSAVDADFAGCYTQ